MVKARKLKSGAWNIQAYSHMDGDKRVYVSLTADTKAECEYKYLEFKKQKTKKAKTDITVRDAITKYIEISKEVLSPTTLSGYRKIISTAFPTIMNKPLCKLSDKVMQEAINEECNRKSYKNLPLSPKTIRNEYGLLSAALKSAGYSFTVRLPKVQHKNESLPEPSEVLNAIKGSNIELPCLLSMWMSLRLSEIRGLTCESVKGTTLYIDQVKVNTDEGIVVKQLAKTDSSIRKIEIPPYILSLINNTPAMEYYRETGENGFLITMPESTIRHTFTRLTKGMGITFHDLRHMFASVSLTVLGIAPKLVQVNGGWSTPAIMETIYSQSFSSEQERAFNIRNSYFETLLNR